MKSRAPEMGRPPIHAWIEATSLNLEHLRFTLIDHHRDAFEQVTPLPFDPPSWLARAVDANLIALIHTLKLYEQAARLTAEIEHTDF